MRINIDHLTKYVFSQPARSVIQHLRVTPQSNANQTILNWDINIDCDAKLTPFRDAYGNSCHILAIDKNIHELNIEVIGSADVTSNNGLVEGAIEPFSPLVYLRPTPLATPSAQIKEFAHDVASSSNKLDALHCVLSAIHKQIAFVVGATNSTTDAAMAFENRQGVCQDLAHIFIAASRALSIPSRYISGHLLRQDGQNFQEASHAWAESYVEGLGWIAFDAANGICADEHYVRVAVGLDYRDAAPVSGARYGGGFETLSVGLHVRQSSEQSQS
ncbi:MAG: transglutaminase [Hyphomonadaceae bacterium]|nr:MAG: transglutaminase [Hyphomonadaceae bacterium]KAF0184921.1 MAG: transglutaminase [Hyphomonadaceae bacterium]